MAAKAVRESIAAIQESVFDVGVNFAAMAALMPMIPSRAMISIGYWRGAPSMCVCAPQALMVALITVWRT